MTLKPRITNRKQISGTYIRIIKMALKQKLLLVFGVITIFGAAGFQLWIPILLGSSVDIAMDVFSAENADVSDQLIFSGVLLLIPSIMRGIFTMAYNYSGESIGQHIGYELRLLYYQKLQKEENLMMDQ